MQLPALSFGVNFAKGISVTSRQTLSCTSFSHLTSTHSAHNMDMLSEEKLLSNRAKHILTSCIYFCVFCYGIACSLPPAARLDIAENMSVNFNAINYAQSTASAGYVIGCLFTGWLFSNINRQIGFMASLLLLAVSMFPVPFLRVLWLYLITSLFNGLGTAGIEVAINSWVLEIWQEASNPYMQGMHFSFALGATIAPLIEEPFLSYDHNVTSWENSTSGELESNATTIHEDSRIVVPYSIASLLLVASAASILVLYFMVPYHQSKRTVTKNQTMDNNMNVGTSIQSSSSFRLMDNEEERDKLYYTQLIILSCFLFCFYTGTELSTMSYLTEFAVVIDLKLSKSTAAFLTSIMSGAFAVNRLISIFVAAKVKTKTMLYVSFVMLSAGNLILLFFANSSEVMLWIAVVIIGSGHSSVIPCIMSLLEERMNVTTSVCGLFMLSASASTI